MILLLLLLIPFVAGLLSWVAAGGRNTWCRWIALVSLLADLLITLGIWIQHPQDTGQWWYTYRVSWIPQFGISLHLAMDGLSLLMLALTFFLGALAVLISWKEIQTRVGFFHFNLLFVLCGITGVFLTMDLFLFYFFWEMMLIPMYFLIGIWGHEHREYAANKFFIFTQAGGLLMLLAILGLYFVHGANTNVYTFDYFDLLRTPMEQATGRWLMLGFLIAFLVKVPAVPFHTWLPDAHTEASTAGSVILAGLLLKTGAYGILRFVLPLFPEAVVVYAPWIMLLGVAGILYGGMLAYAQTDLKRLIAYTSVSHMGFVLLGAFAFNEIAYKGVVMQMIAHGISTGALFIIAGALYERIHTRDIREMGGLWSSVPLMGSAAMIFVMGSLGLPGLGNFIAEFLILLGSWEANHWLTVLATIGLVVATAYSLRIMQHVFFGQDSRQYALQDLNSRELIIIIALVLVICWLGFYPQPVLHTSQIIDYVVR
ncbi:NADH-quinone oxidoreductase subunit M [Chitinophaga nivalis]|uniref:NADH-quinone oxidoreductase subunit M n=1 Tax=Chitinophaga nivalis TaxID=2991709 RepID=A0ABT3IHM5_9BACT|nr:NADH-quinone oxidoreductase subunit M [Chitinophaga nivalis]MCW3466852.1 NADH-quinone oxidoreductase subunit M [Chitinophaga nivalis]MCW3483457.1 NADH-quinone oxidoreductase subunit M [Chitinophaga nivalis]